MIVDSPLTPKEYRAAVRRNLENFQNLRDERISGHIIGSVFSITHHCPTEWNRRITGEMNHAIGFLRKTETGCRVYYLHTTGILAPFYLLVYGIFIVVAMAIMAWYNEIWEEIQPMILPISAACIGICGLSSAISNALTENGIQGGDTLHAFMADPTWR